MRDQKRRMEIYSFYDHTGISAHLEQMAEKGWMLEKIVPFSWVYRRMEPKKIHFAVSYYAGASAFDPEPPEGQRVFWDFCSHAGWKLVCSSAQMQIFCNEQEDPTPIETEAALEVESIHASAKKAFLPQNILLLAVALLNMAMFLSSLLGDPIELLANPTRLYSGLCFAVLLILCIGELACYAWWHGRAVKAAESGQFLRTPCTVGFQRGMLCIVAVMGIYWIVNAFLLGSRQHRWVGALTGAIWVYMVALLVIVNGVTRLLKRRKVAKGVNRAVTLLVDVVLAIVLMGGIIYATIQMDSHGFFAEKGTESYEYHGRVWALSQDAIPLTLEDLTEGSYGGYIRERRGTESLFLGEWAMTQRPRLDAEDFARLPTLSYTIVSVKAPFLYEMCRKRLIYEKEKLFPGQSLSYKASDGAPWGAGAAYRLYDSELGPGNSYLLCYDRALVEIRFDWEPTAEQMAVVGEKLGTF